MTKLNYGLLIVCLTSLLSCGPQKEDEMIPNIIIIMSDDMGYSDIGAYGGEINTPVLNSLAQNGLRFTQFYNTARCCPSRASLLTGLYPHQTGIGLMTDDQKLEGYRGELNKQCVTIAEALKPAGYATYVSGKWHVTKHPKLGEKFSKHNWPLQRGFDKYYGIIGGATSFWDPNWLVRDNQVITAFTDSVYQPEKAYHLTDAISDNAAMFIEEHDASSPFFMYVPYTAAHWPLHARETDIAKYKGKYDAIRKQRFAKMQQLGLANSSGLSETVGVWDSVENKTVQAARMETYAAMVDQMDQGIGRIVQALEEKDMLDNTLILFLQDNGGCSEDLEWIKDKYTAQRGTEPTLPVIPKDSNYYSGATPKQTRDGWPVLFGEVLPGPEDTYLTYQKAWANVSNTPFREYKHWVHEGGISTPLIAHWPKGITSKNEWRDEPSHLIDLMATCLDVAGATYPETFENQFITPLEGKSLLPVFNKKSLDRDYLFWEHEGNRALRMGKWKIVSKGFKSDWELYDLETDRSELKNLAHVYPNQVKEMAEKWEKEAHRTKVYPKSHL